MNEYARQEKAMATKMNCAWPAGMPTAIHELLPRCAPIMGMVAWIMASRSARINANCPISGTICADHSQLLREGFGRLVGRLFCFFNRLRCFGRHVVLIVLCQDLIR